MARCPDWNKCDRIRSLEWLNEPHKHGIILPTTPGCACNMHLGWDAGETITIEWTGDRTRNPYDYAVGTHTIPECREWNEVKKTIQNNNKTHRQNRRQIRIVFDAFTYWQIVFSNIRFDGCRLFLLFIRCLPRTFCGYRELLNLLFSVARNFVVSPLFIILPFSCAFHLYTQCMFRVWLHWRLEMTWWCAMQRFIGSASVCLRVSELNFRRRLHISLIFNSSSKVLVGPISLSLSLLPSLSFTLFPSLSFSLVL